MKALIYELLAFEDLYRASENARKMAVKTRLPVRFKFNGVVMTATRKTSVASMVWTYDMVLSQHCRKYMKQAENKERRK